MTEKQAKELLNRACDIIASLEGWILEGSDYYCSDTAKSVDALFNEIDMLNERATPYENYVATVKRNIDQAVEDGILKSGTECVSYSYMSEEGFNKRIETDPEFAAQWADLEAQDYDTFGEKKV
jgi:hypothetical protein